MNILVVAPRQPGFTGGNHLTAVRWQVRLQALGHQVQRDREFVPERHDVDCLIALHARKSADSIFRFHQAAAEKPVIVCLTGTDLHRDLVRSDAAAGQQAATRYELACRSLEIATRIVLLEPRGKQRLPERFRDRCRVIFQSAEPFARPAAPPADFFQVSVLAHLRQIKDPLRTALAARDLPESSRIRVVHVGKALEPEFRQAAENETRTNPRYHWRGPVSHTEALELLTRSHLTVLSSRAEGAPGVVSESVVNDIPLLTTRIDASIGLLGPEYPGLFDVGDTQKLTELLLNAEQKPGFSDRLRRHLQRLRPQFSPQVESDAWKQLLEGLSGST